MLDIGLTWDIAKKQCGDGTEQVNVVQPDDDGVLGAGIWNAYRAYFSNVHTNTNLLIPFIQGEALPDRDTHESELNGCPNTSENWRLYEAFQGAHLCRASGSSIMNDELVPNAFDIGARNTIPITLRSYIGEDGGAFATEQSGYGMTHETALAKERRGNRGKGWAQFLKNTVDRVGIENHNEICRIMIVSTKADRAKLLRPHVSEVPSSGHTKYTINSADVWDAYVVAEIEKVRSQFSLSHVRHPVQQDKLQSTERYIRQKKLIDQYRDTAWDRLRAFYKSETS